MSGEHLDGSPAVGSPVRLTSVEAEALNRRPINPPDNLNFEDPASETIILDNMKEMNILHEKIVMLNKELAANRIVALGAVKNCDEQESQIRSLREQFDRFKNSVSAVTAASQKVRADNPLAYKKYLKYKNKYLRLKKN